MVCFVNLGNILWHRKNILLLRAGWLCFLFTNWLMSLQRRNRAVAASRYSTLILVNITYPYSDPDTSVERVQPQKFQLKNNLQNATDGRECSKNNMRQWHAYYFSGAYRHDRNTAVKRYKATLWWTLRWMKLPRPRNHRKLNLRVYFGDNCHCDAHILFLTLMCDLWYWFRASSF